MVAGLTIKLFGLRTSSTASAPRGVLPLSRRAARAAAVPRCCCPGSRDQPTRTPPLVASCAPPRMRVAVSAAERAAGALSAAKLEWVASTYEREGLCVLEDLLPHAMLDELAHRYDYDCAHRYVGGDQFKGGQKGPALNPAYDGNLHLQLNLPRCHPYVRPEIVSNPIIEQVAVAVLGGACYIRYINGNSALPGSTVQHLHVDTQGRPGNKLAVNFGIDSISARNGATEVWPGSHRDSGLGPTEALDATGVVRRPSLWQPCCLCRLMVTGWLAGWLAACTRVGGLPATAPQDGGGEAGRPRLCACAAGGPQGVRGDWLAAASSRRRRRDDFGDSALPGNLTREHHLLAVMVMVMVSQRGLPPRSTSLAPRHAEPLSPSSAHVLSVVLGG
eukprot:COSAG01_NODE_11330_length_1956_cov_1.176629_1_plen_388_part_10